jgi:heme/copper-type cytochrome/quinol oxidase subunit 2
MSRLPATTPRFQSEQPRPSLASISVELIFGMLLCITCFSFVYYYFAFQAELGHRSTTHTAYAAESMRRVQAQLKIVINQPGYHKDWPAYSPSTLVVPAYSLVTITIRNYDLGDTPLPKGSPFTSVQGTLGGVASVNGHAYTTVPAEKVAHTFTLPQLGINVPVPGDATTGKPYVEVSFTIRTGAAGSYYFRCMDPCGIGSIGWEGPMLTRGYMLGTLTVQ